MIIEFSDGVLFISIHHIVLYQTLNEIHTVHFESISKDNEEVFFMYQETKLDFLNS